jgi:hypothetical protein
LLVARARKKTAATQHMAGPRLRTVFQLVDSFPGRIRVQEKRSPRDAEIHIGKGLEGLFQPLFPDVTPWSHGVADNLDGELLLWRV